MFDIIQMLADGLRLSDREIRRLVATAPERYKVYSIPKRNGKRRIIAQPAKEVKLAQNILIDKLLRDLPVHDAAMAYVRGRSIYQNAERHCGNFQLLKYDFENFFPSISEFHWVKYCEDKKILSREQALISGRILFRRARGEKVLRLSVGAPSSPILSNILLYDFDKKMIDDLKSDAVTYTRYADDLTFSAERTGHLTVVDRILRKNSRDYRYCRLKVNEDKTVLATKSQRRSVTGLILTLDSKVSIGRDQKRLIRSQIYKWLRGEMGVEDAAKLAGMLAYIKGVEPAFLESLQRKYGPENLKNISTIPSHLDKWPNRTVGRK